MRLPGTCVWEAAGPRGVATRGWQGHCPGRSRQRVQQELSVARSPVSHLWPIFPFSLDVTLNPGCPHICIFTGRSQDPPALPLALGVRGPALSTELTWGPGQSLGAHHNPGGDGHSDPSVGWTCGCGGEWTSSEVIVSTAASCPWPRPRPARRVWCGAAFSLVTACPKTPKRPQGTARSHQL